MQVMQASLPLAHAVHAIIATGMAKHLIRHAIDLADDPAVIFTLAHAGFGLASIRALRSRAVEIAGTSASKKVH